MQQFELFAGMSVGPYTVCVYWCLCVILADLSGNVWAVFYFKSMSEQLELASATNTHMVARAHTHLISMSRDAAAGSMYFL